MKEIKAYVRHDRAELVIQKLEEAGVTGMTLLDANVIGFVCRSIAGRKSKNKKIQNQSFLVIIKYTKVLITISKNIIRYFSEKMLVVAKNKLHTILFTYAI